MKPIQLALHQQRNPILGSALLMSLVIVLSSCVSTIDASFLSTASYHLVFSTQPSSTAVAGSNFSMQPVVQVLDSTNSLSSSYSSSITLSAYSDSACATALSGTLSGSATTSNGVASFAGVKFTKAGVVYLKASSGTSTSACSNAITVSPGSATQFVFTRAPSSTGNAGVNFATQPVVSAQDSGGNVDLTFNNPVSLVPYTNSVCTSVAPGLLSNSSVTASSGIAAFSGQNFSTASTLYLKASNAYDQVVLGDGPIAYWKLNESAGPVVADSSASSYTGSYNGSYTLGQTGPLANASDTATQFDGSSAYVSTSDLPGFAANFATTGFSAEVWFNTTNTTGGETLLGTLGPAQRPSFSFVVNANGNGAFALDTFRFVAGDNAGNYLLGDGQVTGITDGNWHHVVITENFQASTVTLTVDGVAQSGLDVRGGGATTWIDFVAPLQIGAYNDIGFGRGFFTGSIGQVSLYNYVLSSSQITNHYFAGHNTHSVLSAACSSSIVVSP